MKKDFAWILRNMQYSRLWIPSTTGKDRWITISYDGFEVLERRVRSRQGKHIGTGKTEKDAVRIALKEFTQ